MDKIQGLRFSPQQQCVWSMQPDSSVYVAQCAILLEGNLKVEALKETLQEIISRHEILRTTFHRRPGIKVPIQVIVDCSRPSWHSFDLSENDPAEQAVKVEAFFREARISPSDLDKGPLLRAALFTLSTDKHILHISLPSLCADAWTLKNLVHEISSLYTRSLQDREKLDEVLQYADFSEWQNELLQDEDADTGKAHWLDKDLSVLPESQLPFEKKPLGKSEFEPDSLVSVIEKGQLVKIETIAQKYDTSLAVCLFTCWQILIGRLTGQPDIIIGYVFDGRKYQELHNAVGLFAKSAPVFCHYGWNSRFQESLVQADQTISDAHDWQEYFIYKQSEGVRGNVINFPIGFEFDEEISRHYADGVSFSVYKQHTCIERFKVKLSCVQKEDSLIAEFRYDTNLFLAEDIKRLMGQFNTLLENVLDNPDAAIGELGILSNIEQQELLVELNNTQVNYPQDKCIHQLFEEQVSYTPESIAVVFEDQQLTYQELNIRANQLAYHLRALGVKPEAQVGICMKHSLDMIVGILGILKAGGAYLPLDPAYPKERLTFMMADAQASVLLTHQHLIEEFSGCKVYIICLDTSWEAIALDNQDNPINEVNPRNRAYVIYTSGSTGEPKGVIISHQGLVNYLSWCLQAYAVADGQGTPVHSSIGFDLTVTSLFSPLLVGKPLTLLSKDQGIEALNATLHTKSDFSLVKITPSHLEALNQLSHSEKVEGRTRVLVIGGEALFGTHLSFWQSHAPGTRLINEYGPTETVVGSCVYEVPTEVWISGTIPIGQPIANTQVYLLNSHLQPVPIHVTGELYIGGAGLARGYLNHPDLTAERFIPHPFGNEPGARMYKTGDLARFLSDGNVEFLGRIDHQVKLRGYRIELGEIEAILSQHPAIQQTAVLVREDTPGTKCLVAYFVSSQEPMPNTNDLRRFVGERLPDYMVPQVFVKLDILPLTPNGKIDRLTLPVPEANRPELEHVYIPPRTAVEQTLATVWSEALGIEQVGIHDNFFALGGDSIRSVRVVGLAKKRGLNFSVKQLFQYQTIYDITHELSINEMNWGPAIQTAPFSLISEAEQLKIPDDVQDAYPLTMLQAGMLYHMDLTPDLPPYHNINSWHLRTYLDPEILQEVVQQVVARHAVLRTSFDLTTYNEPLQLVHKTASLPISVEDLRHLSFDKQEEVLNVFWENEWRRIFDLSHPPLLRFHIHRRTDDTFQFTLVECHAIIDGWSTTSTLAEIFNIYGARLNNECFSDDPPQSISYRDFVQLERMALKSEEHHQYWTQKLTDYIPTNLPRWPSATQRTVGSRIRRQAVDIPTEVVEKLKYLAQSITVSLKSVLLAAHLKALSLISGQIDILTGLSTHGRPEETDAEQVRGLFLNIVPFRIKLSEGTWIDLVRETFEAEVEMLPFRSYPLAALQNELGNERLFETIFNFLHFHSVEDVLRDHVEVLSSIDWSETNFTLMAAFHLEPVSLQLNLELHWDSTELCENQIQAMADCYLRTLSVMAFNPHSYHAQLNMLKMLSTPEKILLDTKTLIEELDEDFS